MGVEALGPFTALGEPVIDLVDAMPYPGIYKLTELAPTAGIVRSVFVETLRSRIGRILEGMRAATSPMATFSSASSAGPWPACQRATPPSLIAMRRSWSFLTPYVGDAARISPGRR